MSHGHTHDGINFHTSHGPPPPPDHGHSHEVLDGPGSYMGREMPIIEGRDWSERAFTVGIGGYVYLFYHVSFLPFPFFSRFNHYWHLTGVSR